MTHRSYPPKPSRVYFYGTCLVDVLFPEAGLHGIQLLEREGIEVVFPSAQSCCAQPAFNAGYDQEAREVALAQLACMPENIPVVVPSASCAAMFIDAYPKLFANSPHASAAQHLADRTFELLEFLAEVCRIQLQDKGEPIAVVAHHSCSALRHLKVVQPAEQLLKQLANVALLQQQRPDECCGFGGTFAVKEPEISGAMVEDKCNNLVATGANRLVSGDCSCMMNIVGALEKRGDNLPGQHIATFLWERTQ